MKKRVIAVMLSLAMTVTAIPSAMPVYAEENPAGTQETMEEPEEILVEMQESQDAGETAPVQESAAEPEIVVEDSTVVPQQESKVAEISAAEDLSAMMDLPMPVATANADITKISVTVTGDEESSDSYPAGTFSNETSLTQTAANTKISFDPAKAGEDQKLPDVEIEYEGTALEKDTDYTVTGENLVNAAEATDVNAPALTIKFYGDYENLGNIVVKFGITPASLEDAVINYAEKQATGDWAVEYDGEEHVPTITSVTLKQVELTEGVDYTVDPVEDKKNAQESISFNVTGKGNYIGSPAAVIYKIEKTAAEKGIGLADPSTLVFENVDGALSFDEVETAIEAGVKNTLDPADVLANNKDYEIVCYEGAETLEASKAVADSEEAKTAGGIHKYEIKMTAACRNFTEDTVVAGSYVIKAEWPLEKIVNEIQKEAIDEAAAKAGVYSGADLKAAITKAITEAVEGYTSAVNQKNEGEFVVTCADEKIVDCGTYVFTVAGAKDSDWEGQTAEVTVEVTPKEMAADATTLADGFKLDVTQKYYADGSADAPVLKFTENGKELKEGTDYTCDLGYDESLRNVVTTAKITGMGNYKTTVNGKAAAVEWTIDPAISKVIDLADKTIHAEVTAKFDYHPEELTLKAEDITVTQDIPGRDEPYQIDPSNYYISATDYGTDKEAGQSKKAGLHHVTIAAKLNTGYTGEIKDIEFTVEGIDINTHYALDTSELDKQEIEFDSEVSCPNPTVVAKGTDKLLNTDNYKLSYSYMKNGKKTYIENNGENLFTVNDKITFPEPGTYTIEVIPDAEMFEMYMGTLECTVEILAKSIANEQKFTVSCGTEITWPGQAVTVKDLISGITVKEMAADKVLAADKDYTVEIADGDKIGTATVTITGIGNYRNSVQKKVKINKQTLTGAEVTYAKDSIPYCSDLSKALNEEDVTVKVNGEAVDPAEYTVSCKYADSPANNKVTITVTAVEDGHYSDFAEAEVLAEPGADITKFALEGFKEVLYFYAADAEKGVEQELVLRDEKLGVELEAGKDYTVTYVNNKPAAGSDLVIATVTLTGKGNAADGTGYYGTITKNFTIALPALKEVTVVADQDLSYTGAPILPEVTVIDANGKEVPKDAYKVSGKENQDAGTATVVVTALEGKGYTGFAETTFTITQAQNAVEASISPAQIRIDDTAKVTASAKGGAKLTYTSSDEKVAAVAADGTVTGKAAGTAVITVSAAATMNYKAAVKTVTIVVLKKENSVSVTGAPSEMKVDESAKVTASAQGEAKLSFASSDEKVATVAADGTVTAKAEGTAVITVNAAETDEFTAASTTFTVTVTKPQVVPQVVAKEANTITASNVKKIYSTKKQSFRLKATVAHEAPLSYESNKSAVRVDSTGKVMVKAGFVGIAQITITAAETDKYEKAVKTIKVKVKPTGTKLRNMSSNGGTLTLRWVKNPVATGYQIQYSRDDSFKKKSTISVKGVDSATKRLTKGKTYYVRIRVFKTISGKRIYSKWSKAQTIRIK